MRDHHLGNPKTPKSRRTITISPAVAVVLEQPGRSQPTMKTAGVRSLGNHDGPVPYFDDAGRVKLLRNAVDLAQSCSHPALPRLLNVIESPSGPVLVYEAAGGSGPCPDR